MTKNPLRSALSLTVAFVLASVSLFSAVVASNLNYRSSTQPTISYDHSLATPVLSGRRIPKTIQADIASNTLQADVNDFVASAPASTCVVVERDGVPITEPIEAQTPLLPASNQKILTTYVALQLLGSDYQFNTTVFASGLSDGVAQDLHLVGSGDPYLVTKDWPEQFEEIDGRTFTFLDDLADAIVDAGITEVSGSIIADESRYDSVRTGPWATRLVTQNQSGPLSAATTNEGFTSWGGELDLSSRVRSENPASNTAILLNNLLSARGVLITGQPSVGATPPGTTSVASVSSAPLDEIVTYINSYSSNYGAEQLLKELGYVEQGTGSTEVGAAVVREYLNRAGFDLTGIEVTDGSGLSEDNRLTCDLLVDIFSAAGPTSDLADSLAISGQRGSLLERFSETSAQGRVIAKTGTLRGSTALSGFVTSAAASEVEITFAYIANDIDIDGRVIEITSDLVVDFSQYPEGPDLALLGPVDALLVQE